MNLLSKILGSKSDSSASPRSVREDGDVVLEMSDGSSVHLEEDEVYINLKRIRNRRIFVSGESIDLKQGGPIAVHIPVETKTAANNLENKSELNARMPQDVVRYSKVVNSSNDPEKDVPLDVPFVEIWF